MKSLHQIGLECGTDKSFTHKYCDVYERYLAPWRDKEFTLLEIGVGAGGSLKMWHEFSPKAKIVGIDTNPDCAGYCQPPIEVFIGSQTDTQFLTILLEIIGTPDVIIDDGSHYCPDTIATFKWLFPKIASGGLYIVEDCHCFYDSTYGLAPPYGQGMSEVYKFFSGLDVHVDVHGRGMCGDQDFAINHPSEIPPVPEYSKMLRAIHIHTSLRIFEKK